MTNKLELLETTESEIIDEVADETNDDYTDDSLYSINSWGADFSFRELVQMYDEGDLVKPEIQRNYVWNEAEASRFIDSVLLGLPVPSIFLARTKAETMLIIDGYQRIMTVRDFIRGHFGEEKKIFRLTNSPKIHSNWRGKTFAQLTESEQRRIRKTTIHSIIFVQNHPEDQGTSYFQIFERINSTGRALIPQEIRNCVYQGPFNSLLIKLNKENTGWRNLYGLGKTDSRMRDIEFILRYFAIASGDWRYDDVKGQNPIRDRVWRRIPELKGQISLKKFLNEFMGSKESSMKTVLKERERSFNETIAFIAEHFGETAFQNLATKKDGSSGEFTGKFNPPIFDSIMTATQLALESGHSIDSNSLQKKRLKLLSDDDFRDVILVRTTNRDRIAKRINMALSYLYGLEYE